MEFTELKTAANSSVTKYYKDLDVLEFCTEEEGIKRQVQNLLPHVELSTTLSQQMRTGLRPWRMLSKHRNSILHFLDFSC
jgi:hypothetical protein